MFLVQFICIFFSQRKKKQRFCVLGKLSKINK